MVHVIGKRPHHNLENPTFVFVALRGNRCADGVGRLVCQATGQDFRAGNRSIAAGGNRYSNTGSAGN
jgi:hypothetical protein